MSQLFESNAGATLNSVWRATLFKGEYLAKLFRNMYAVNILRSFSRSFPTKARTVFSALVNLQRNPLRPKYTSFNKRPHTENDVVLYKYENPKFFLLVNIVSGIQCAFWTYLGVFLFQSVKSPQLDTRKNELWNIILEKERKYSDILCAITLFFGWSMFFATMFYSLRSIRKLILHRGGRAVTIVTYNLPGHNTIKVPLSCVSSSEHRVKAKKFIPMKVKDKYFYFLMDVKGEFYDPELFDCTAGIKRNF